MDAFETYNTIKIQKRSKLLKSWKFLAEHCSEYMVKNECFEVRYTLSSICQLANTTISFINSANMIQGMEEWGYEVEIDIPKDIDTETIVIISIPKKLIEEKFKKEA